MKNILGVSRSILISLLLMTGCNNQVQPTNTPTATFKPTTTSSPIATPTFLPTFTPLPPFLITPPPLLPKGIFDPFRESIYEPADFVNDISKTAFGVISSGSTIEEKATLDTTQPRVVFSLFWKEGDLDLILTQPDGKVIDSSMAKSVKYYFDYWTHDRISFMSDSVSKKYYFLVPQTGIWTIKILGKSTPVIGSNYMLQVTSMSATSFSKHFDKPEYTSGDIITLSASIEDGVSGSLLTPPEYIHNVSMKVIVEDPAKKQYSFELYDDGLHGDGKSDDGVYANTFSNTLPIGKYNFYLQISGKNNRDKQPFAREYFFSTVVK
jgi:hypothetical protein